jgi:hypothetical protein
MNPEATLNPLPATMPPTAAGEGVPEVAAAAEAAPAHSFESLQAQIEAQAQELQRLKEKKHQEAVDAACAAELQEPAVQNAIHAGDEARAAHKPLRSVWPDGMTAEQLFLQGSPACAHLPGYASNVDYELRFRLVTTMVALAKNCPYWTLPVHNKSDHRMTSKYAFEEFSSALRSSPDFKAAVSYVSIAALATLCPCILHR